MSDLISDSSHTPTLEEITAYIQPPGRGLWQDINTHLQTQYRSKPKIFYSVCAGKPGWNVKYQKSGKSLCVLYPERDCFMVLVVLSVDLLEAVDQPERAIHPDIRRKVQTIKPLNGGVWLMFSITDHAYLDTLKKLIALKLEDL